MSVRETRMIYSLLGAVTALLAVWLPGWLKVLAPLFYLAAFVYLPEPECRSER